MTSVLDLRENPAQQMQVVQGVGGGISDMLNAYRNRKMEQRVIGVLNDPNMKAEQKRLQLLKDADFLRSPTGQKMMSDELSGQAALQMQERQARLANLQAGTRATQARAGYYEQGGARKTPAASDLTADEKNYLDLSAKLEAANDPNVKKVIETALIHNPIYQQRKVESIAEEGRSVLPTLFPDLVKSQTRTTRRAGVFGDKVYGQDAYAKALQAAIEKGNEEYGLDPGETQSMFDTWWDSQYQAEQGQRFQEFAPRPTEGAQGIENTAAQRELAPLTDEQARRNARPIASKEEYDALPPGSYFIAPNGELRQKNG